MARFPYFNIWDEEQRKYPQSPANLSLINPEFQRQQRINQMSDAYNQVTTDDFGNVLTDTDMFGRTAYERNAYTQAQKNKVLENQLGGISQSQIPADVNITPGELDQLKLVNAANRIEGTGMKDLSTAEKQAMLNKEKRDFANKYDTVGDVSNIFTGAVEDTAKQIPSADNKEKTTPVPEEAVKVQKELPSLWEQMQTKDWWFNPIEGGAGGWDNRLFRLGEMMTWMGTPLDKRGKNPASRWTTAATESDKIKAAIEKERIKAAGKGTDIFSKVGNKQLESSIKQDVFEKMGGDQWLALDPGDEELNQQVSEAAIAIQTLMKSGMSFANAKQAVLDAIE